MGLPVAQLVATELDRIVVRRRAEQEVVNEPGGWQRSILSPVVPGVNFEWIRTTLPPGCDAGVFFAYASGSHEFLAVVEGGLRLTIDTTTVDLKAGDSVYFAADATHCYENPTRQPCTYFVAALTMRPRGAGRSSRRVTGAPQD